jgi:hypothetical protein
MEIEVLHNMEGDKKKKFDTKTEEGRKDAESFFKKLMRGGTAIFIETKAGTYRVTKYDPKKDRLTVRFDKGGKSREITAKSTKGRKTAVPPRAGG